MVVNNPHELRGKAVSSRGPLNKAPSIEQPATAEQLAKTLHDAATQKLAVIPVGGGRAADEIEFVFIQIKENGIANDVPVMATGNKLLGLIDFESLEAIYRKIGEEFERVVVMRCENNGATVGCDAKEFEKRRRLGDERLCAVRRVGCGNAP